MPPIKCSRQVQPPPHTCGTMPTIQGHPPAAWCPLPSGGCKACLPECPPPSPWLASSTAAQQAPWVGHPPIWLCLSHHSTTTRCRGGHNAKLAPGLSCTCHQHAPATPLPIHQPAHPAASTKGHLPPHPPPPHPHPQREPCAPPMQAPPMHPTGMWLDHTSAMGLGQGKPTYHFWDGGFTWAHQQVHSTVAMPLPWCGCWLFQDCLPCPEKHGEES